MIKQLFCLCLFITIGLSGNAQNKYAILPQPQQLIAKKGFFQINNNTLILIPEQQPDILSIAEILNQRLQISSGFNLKIIPYKGERIKNINKNYILFKTEKSLTAEGYGLNVESSKITCSASSAKGLFYGLQTFFQLLPATIFASSIQPKIDWKVPNCEIKDAPAFSYRGVMLDVSRHFYPIPFIKKYLDLLSLHKINTFHWHLTDDQGWRIEIKKYPKLTDIGSKRKETVDGHFAKPTFDGKPHQGFYTQEQIREIVDYAQKKYITIIPEIEMPGHATAALAAYPELSCSGSPLDVGTRWGVYDDVFCPTESTFQFLESVLEEIIELFPSPYIHIGGDECPTITWEKSAFCQELIKKNGLKNEHELQGYFIKRIDKFLTSKNKKLIGWDEILEGGISPNATIMSWRGTEGGIQAAKQKHDAIMTPGEFCYLNTYQSDPSSEPLGNGGLLPLEKVYSYQPIPKELSSEEAKHILGVQANLWTEYISDYSHLEYMTFPRVIALSEVAWTNPSKKSYHQFIERLKVHFKRLDLLAVNYAKAYYDVKAITKFDANNRLLLSLESADNEVEIRYTTDGNEPNFKSKLYSNEIILSEDTFVRAVCFSKNGQKLGKDLSKLYYVNQSTGKRYTLKDLPKKYLGGNERGLCDGQKGELNNFDTWVGFEGKDLEMVLDLEKANTINQVKIGFLGARASWIMLPKQVKVSFSKDGKIFENEKSIILGKVDDDEKMIQQMNINLEQISARFIKIHAENYGLLPDNHPGKGFPSWLFVDEVGVE